jgi:hypothetical protein
VKLYEIAEVPVDYSDQSNFFDHNILPHCKPFLDLVYPQSDRTLKGYMKSAERHLVRGMHTRDAGMYRTNPMRQPTGTIPKLSEILSKIFVKLAGYDIRKKNALFGTFDDMAAYSFGPLHYIFPIGDFKYHYLDGVDDLNSDLWAIARGEFDFDLHYPFSSDLRLSIQSTLKNMMLSHENDKRTVVSTEELQQVEQFLLMYMTKMFPLKDDGLAREFVTGQNTSELIFTVNSYYAIPVDMSWLEG